jgi:hypothetical protein
LGHCETPQSPHNSVDLDAIIFVSLELPVGRASIKQEFVDVSA